MPGIKENASLMAMMTGIACCLNAQEPDAETTMSRPNIVFIFADDWGWGDLSVHGHPYIQTPNVDRLAAEGLNFQQFNVLNPVCSPSRTAALTGQFPARWGVHQHFGPNNVDNEMGDWLNPDAPSIARLLQSAGYRTGHFGKWHLTNRIRPDVDPADAFGDAPHPTQYGFDETAVWVGPPPGLHRHRIGEAVGDFIKRNADHPFYVNVWLAESHTPHTPTEESMEQFRHLDHVDQVYAAVIADGDRWVGQVLDALDEAGVADRTLVIFSSDNGPEERIAAETHKLMGPGYGRYYSVGTTGGLRGQKRSLFEGGVRTPFIVRWPGRAPAGQINDTTVFSAVDLFPTFAAAAGVPLPEGYQSDGEDLLRAFHGELIRRTRPIFWEWRGPKWDPDFWPALAVRDGDWKLVRNSEGRVELYRLPIDRAESRDLAEQHPEIVQRLRDMLDEWKDSLPTEIDPTTISRYRP